MTKINKPLEHITGPYYIITTPMTRKKIETENYVKVLDTLAEEKNNNKVIHYITKNTKIDKEITTEEYQTLTSEYAENLRENNQELKTLESGEK